MHVRDQFLNASLSYKIAQIEILGAKSEITSETENYRPHWREYNRATFTLFMIFPFIFLRLFKKFSLI